LGAIGFHDLRPSFKFGELTSGWSAGLFCGELPSRDREVAIKVLPAALARDPERIYVTGLVDQELLLQSEYLAAENRILRGKLNPPYQPAAPKVRNGTRESIFVFQSTPTLVISPRMGFVGFSPKGVLLHAKIKINRPFIDHNL